MRKKIYIPALLVVFVSLLTLIWWRPGNLINNSRAPIGESTFSPDSVPAASNGNQNQNAATASQPQTAPALGSQKEALNGRQSPEAIRQYMESQNVPVEFYGKVVNQDGNPVLGAKVKVKVRHWTVIVPAPFGASGGMIHVQLETDSGGLFEIRGVTGDGFDVESITKEGYELEPSQRTYGATGGSLAEPVIFKMWSTDIHEKLITGGKSFHIVPDGRPYVIDLTKGTIAESGDGDLKVWVKRPEQITYGKRYDWSCEMDVINGGLLAASDSSMYFAPTDGYAPSFQFEQKIGSGWGDTTGPKRFYVRLNNGQMYGRITIELFAYYNDRVPGMIRIQYALNPSGSRILR